MRIVLRITACLVAVCAVAIAEDEKPAPPRLVNVLVLGKQQLLSTPHGFPEFCAQNAAKPRSELRAEVVARLKELADAERPRLVAAVGKDTPTQPLWLLNAVAARVPQDQVATLRAHDDVHAVFPAGIVPAWRATSRETGPLKEILEPAEREPFTTKGKKVSELLTELRVPEVWQKLGVTGAGALVMSFDMGLDYRHADLRGNVWRNADEVPDNGEDDDRNGIVDDVYGYDFTNDAPEVIDTGRRQHGTLTSSLIVGDGSGGLVTGVAPSAQLMAVRAAGGPYLAARAFQYGLENDVDVVNMSFSIPDLKQVRGLWRRMAENATCAGLVLVSGSGNFQQQVEVPVQIRIPEGIPCVICVGGVTKKRKLAPFSSIGPVEWESVTDYGDFALPEGLIKPDLAAFPGPGLPLAGPGENGYLPKNNGRRGNSLSAPQVTGTVALMLSAHPELTPWAVKDVLEKTARDIPPKGKDPETGAGLLDAFAAVERAIELRDAAREEE
jgi:subtilisin family serine protease